MGNSACDARLNSISLLDLTTGSFSEPRVTGTPPPPREYHTSILYCSSTFRRLVVTGGRTNPRQAHADLFVLDIPGDLSGTENTSSSAVAHSNKELSAAPTDTGPASTAGGPLSGWNWSRIQLVGEPFAGRFGRFQISCRKLVTARQSNL